MAGADAKMVTSSAVAECGVVLESAEAKSSLGAYVGSFG
jgi:hypothetical protein